MSWRRVVCWFIRHRPVAIVSSPYMIIQVCETCGKSFSRPTPRLFHDMRKAGKPEVEAILQDISAEVAEYEDQVDR